MSEMQLTRIADGGWKFYSPPWLTTNEKGETITLSGEPYDPEEYYDATERREKGFRNKYKIVQELYKDDRWRIALVKDDKYPSISVWERRKTKYTSRRRVMMERDKPEKFFVTCVMFCRILGKVTDNQYRYNLKGIREELKCDVITQEHLEALKALHLAEKLAAMSRPKVNLDLI